MDTEHKEKVRRWKIAIQYYEFDVCHIEGKLNIEADALSRSILFPALEAFEQRLNLKVLENRKTIEQIEELNADVHQKFVKHMVTISALLMIVTNMHYVDGDKHLMLIQILTHINHHNNNHWYFGDANTRCAGMK